MQWETILLNQNPEIKYIPKPALSEALSTQIENIWSRKKQLYPSLFNGRVFTVSHLTSQSITGYWTDYKQVLAQMEHPELYADLNLHPLAVNGLIHCPDGFVLGKRNATSIYLPNYWQSPPAGSIESRQAENTINLLQQLYVEAQEELGMEPYHLSDPLIISATKHQTTHIIDIGILLETKLSFQKIKALWEQNANTEYDALLCVPVATCELDRLLPTTQFLMKAWRQHYLKN